jgi:hypothetical protein
VPRAPCPTRHRTDVSDSHRVPSHPEAPILSRAVIAAILSPAPCTVIEAALVPARLTRRDTLSAISKDQACVALPALSATVATVRLVPRALCPTRHRTDVSDSHSVPSHPDCPTRPFGVNATSPRPAPCTVNDADPVPARFDPRVTRMLPTSTEYMALLLPVRSPAVIATRRVPRAACPTLHLTDVSDCHSVLSPSVPPNLANAVNDTNPSLAPWTVTLVDPVPPLFILLSMLSG